MGILQKARRDVLRAFVSYLFYYDAELMLYRLRGNKYAAITSALMDDLINQFAVGDGWALT